MSKIWFHFDNPFKIKKGKRNFRKNQKILLMPVNGTAKEISPFRTHSCLFNSNFLLNFDDLFENNINFRFHFFFIHFSTHIYIDFSTQIKKKKLFLFLLIINHSLFLLSCLISDRKRKFFFLEPSFSFSFHLHLNCLHPHHNRLILDLLP